MEAPSSISLFAIRKFWLWLFGVVVLHSSFLTTEAVASELAKDKAKAVIEAQIEAMAIDDWSKAFSFARFKQHQAPPRAGFYCLRAVPK